MKKQILFLLILVVSICSNVTTYCGEQEFLTGERASRIIETSVDGYGIDFKAQNQLSDIDKEPLTLAEGIVLLDNAFQNLPSPNGDNLRRGVFLDHSLISNTHWARKSILNLSNAGLLTEEDITQLDEYMTEKQMKALLARIWAYLGKNKKDDFYAYVNKKELCESVLPPGKSSDGAFTKLARQNSKKIMAILAELSGEMQEEGTKKQKVVDFYNTAKDRESQTIEGIKPIQKYIDLFKQSETIQDLIEAECILQNETGCSALFQFYVAADSKNSNKNSLYFSGTNVWPSKGYFKQETISQSEAYQVYIKDLFLLVGYNTEEAEKEARSVYELKKEIAQSTMDIQNYHDVDQTYNVYSKKEFINLFDGFEMEKLLDGTKLKKAKKIIVIDESQAVVLSKIFQKENLELLKNYAVLEIVQNFSDCLGDEFQKSKNQLTKQIYGISEAADTDELTVALCQNYMGDYLGELYVERYFTEKSKNDILNMTKYFIEIYKEKISKLDWMSQTTKKKAIEKLDKLTVKIAYPDEFKDRFQAVTITTYKQGGSLCGNVINIEREIWKENRNQLNKKANKEDWLMNVFDVNAYYYAANNEIVFPAGILQQPFYDPLAKDEQNYGGIGVVIAHEISHAFDDSGAKFDEKGNAKDWWTKEDYEQFQLKCDSVVKYYDDIEILPGLKSNGLLTLGENVADIGGISCALEAMKDIENPDYNAFFENYAKIWRKTSTREAIALSNSSDTHSRERIRVNKTISNFEEFYDTYNITPNDGMFVPKNERVGIW